MDLLISTFETKPFLFLSGKYTWQLQLMLRLKMWVGQGTKHSLTYLEPNMASYGVHSGLFIIHDSWHTMYVDAFDPTYCALCHFSKYQVLLQNSIPPSGRTCLSNNLDSHYFDFLMHSFTSPSVSNLNKNPFTWRGIPLPPSSMISRTADMSFHF